MNHEAMSTLQSAIELDRTHNEGKLLRALKAEHITKEEMIASIFNIVQKRNAQQETQKLLSTIAAKQDDVFTDYWEKTELSWRDKILNKLFFDQDGEINFYNIKNIGIGALVSTTTLIIIIRIIVVKFKHRIQAISRTKSEKLRNRHDQIFNKDQNLGTLKETYKKRLSILNKILEYDTLSSDDRETYKTQKTEIEKLLNNDDNLVGGIVEEVQSV